MRRTTAFRPVLACGLLLSLPLANACIQHPFKPVELEKDQGKKNELEVQVNKDVDILVVVDNSGTMAEEQANLGGNFGGFIDILEAEDVDANYRIGITTSDNGNVLCSGTSPEAGTLRLSACTTRETEFTNLQGTENRYDEACAANCTFAAGEGFTESDILPTSTARDPEPRPRPWIERNEGVTNLPAGVNTVDAFACAGPQGINGCGFESQLESMFKALARAETNGENQFDFLRQSAILAVLIVTDEVDCSMNPDWDEEVASVQLPEANRLLWENPAGNPTSSICWNAGVTCEGDPSGYSSCDPVDKGVGAPDQLPKDNNPLSGGTWPTEVIENPTNPSQNAVLFPVSKYISQLQGLEDVKKSFNPQQEVIFGLIAGVPTDYATNPGTQIQYADATDPQVQNDFGIGYGCTSTVANAVPPVRMRAVAESFEIDGRNIYSICATDFGPALEAVADAIRQQVKPACFPQCVEDTDPSTPALDPSCKVFQTVPGMAKQEVAECDGVDLPAGEPVCYYYLTEADTDFASECTARSYNLEFKIVRDPSLPVPAGTTITADCQLSDLPSVDCPGFQG